jgi:CheY-like chemotaxis protein
MRAVLSPFGWEIEEADDGSAGFTKILETEIDLLITDLQMSPVGGAELIMAVMLLPAHRRPRVIVCSADHDSRADKLAQAMHQADKTIPKPFTPAVVMTAVLEVLSLTFAEDI